MTRQWLSDFPGESMKCYERQKCTGSTHYETNFDQLEKRDRQKGDRQRDMSD